MSKLKPAIGAGDHAQGNTNASIKLVEYGDYQCPHCGRAYPIIKVIQKKMGNELQFIFRNFPLAEIHEHAMNAALAAEAAGLQDKYWEMHDIIFENQDELDNSSLLKHAAKLHLDIEKFTSDFEKPEIREKVESDFESGIRSGVNGTPSFFINGEKYEGDWEGKEFLKHLESLV